MKLLLISIKSTSPTGGIAVWTEHFLSYCRQHDIDCHLVNTELIGKRTTTLKRTLWGEWKRTRGIFRSLRRQLRENDFDAVYLNTSCGTYGLFRDARLGKMVHKKRVPLITHYHCEIPYWVKRSANVRTLGQLAHMSQHNLVLCQNSLRFLKEHYGVDAKKVPNFVTTDLVRTTAKEVNGPIQQILFVGNITEQKGACELYRLARQFPHIRFTLIGSVKDTVASWDKPENITLTGHIPQEEMIPLLDAADLFLFPSHTEGCSMALMEAMARGLPAIATDTGANGEMLADGCGIVVPLHDTTAMAEAIIRLDNPALREAMSAKAIQKIARYYTDQNVNTLMELVQPHSAD